MEKENNVKPVCEVKDDVFKQFMDCEDSSCDSEDEMDESSTASIDDLMNDDVEDKYQNENDEVMDDSSEDDFHLIITDDSDDETFSDILRRRNHG